MKKITFAESNRLSAPHLFGALVTKNDDGKVNIMGISWFTFLSIRENMMLLCVGQKAYTNELLRKLKRATLCLVSEGQKDVAMKCGRNSGRTTDKAAEFGIELAEAEGFPAPVLAKATVCWALELKETVEAGDHTVFICSVTDTVLVQNEKHVMAFDGYSRLDTV